MKNDLIKLIGQFFIVVGGALLILVIVGNGKPSFGSKTPTKEVLTLTTEKDKFPGIVRLTTLEGQFYCSGTVISDTEILTAAHCVYNMPLNMLVQSMIVNNNQLNVLSTAFAINVRADVAIIRGDFSSFSKFKYDPSPASDILVNDYNLTACGFPYSGELVCYKLTNPIKMVDVIGVNGQLYAGMSGGPVLDLSTGTIYAVNHAVTEGMVLIAPIINLKNGLSIIKVK